MNLTLGRLDSPCCFLQSRMVPNDPSKEIRVVPCGQVESRRVLRDEAGHLEQAVVC